MITFNGQQDYRGSTWEKAALKNAPLILFLSFNWGIHTVDFVYFTHVVVGFVFLWKRIINFVIYFLWFIVQIFFETEERVKEEKAASLVKSRLIAFLVWLHWREFTMLLM